MYKQFYAQGNNLGEVVKSGMYLNVIASNKKFMRDLSALDINPKYANAKEYKEYITLLRNLGLVFVFNGQPIFPSELYIQDIEATKDEVLVGASELYSSACALEPKFKEVSIDVWYSIVKYTYLVQPFICKSEEPLKSAKSHLSFAVLPFDFTVCLFAQACTFFKLSREDVSFYFKLADLNLYKDFNLFSSYLNREYIKGLDISNVLRKGAGVYGSTNQTNKFARVTTSR